MTLPYHFFHFTDAPLAEADDGGRFARDYATFAARVGARYAVHFATSQCYLHKEVFHLNGSVVTPIQVSEHFQARGILRPQLQVLVSGDLWSLRKGFAVADNPYFRDRDRCLEEYRWEQSPALERY